jgi:hypothetical protein
MDTFLNEFFDNYYVSFILIVILFIVIYYYVCLRKFKCKKIIERFASKCCPDDYPDLIYDWKFIGKCFNKHNVGIDPIPKCLPPNPLLRPFNNALKPRNYIF